MNNPISQDFDPFSGGELTLTAPTTESQQEIWLAVELGGREANLAYNECVSLHLIGQLVPGSLVQALTDVVSRHESLRTTFSRDGSTLCVEDKARLQWKSQDLSSLPVSERAAARKEALREEATEPFDLALGPLFRARLIQTSSTEAELILTAHHIVCDGWSVSLLVEEIGAAYAARSQGQAVEWPPAPLFSEYSVQTRKSATSQEAVEAERFWLKTLGPTPATLDLPTDQPRPAVRAFDATRQDWQLEPELLDQLRTLGKKAGSSLVATLLAAVSTFLYRITGQTDFVVGMPAAGQSEEGLSRLVGHCVNTLPIRVILDPATPFLDHVRATKRAILDAFEQQRLSFGGLLQKLELPRDASRIPLIPVLFNVDPRSKPLSFGSLQAKFVSNPRSYDSFELFLNACENDLGLGLELTYSTRLFDKETILLWLEELTVLLGSVVKSPETALGRIPLLSDRERKQLLLDWNSTQQALPEEPSVLAMIEAQTRRTPDALAVQDGDESLTYRELDERANHLAHRLRDAGVNSENRVGIALDRSCWMVAALLATWKAGAAYVPLDPDYPPARLDFIAEDAALEVLVTQHSLGDILAERATLTRIWVDEDVGSRSDAPLREDAPNRLAYVLHTSGSTGKPKGVQVEHGSLVNFLASMAREPGLTAQDVLLAVTTLSFDIAGLELFLPLTVGAQVVVAAREISADGAQLARLLSSSGTTVFQATPATWRLLVEADWHGGPAFKGMCGGETLPKELAVELLRRMGSLWNVYGPTETTVWSSCTRISESTSRIPIGRPIANTTAYLLDALGEPVPTGTLGELFLGGLGVARGYLNRPDLTDERFVPDPFASVPGARLYRTGDLARYDSTGQLYFERRNDGQVKVRGFRIELGEIESGLDQHPEVRQACAVVSDFGAGDVRLVAYVVPKSGAKPKSSTLRDHLQNLVPSYMVPQHFILLEAMPLTPNGKVDRKALPKAARNSTQEDTYFPPVTSVQEDLVRIWTDLLRVPKVGIRDGFFEQGGHSMLAARMLARVREVLKVEIPLRTIFLAQTVEALSAHVEAALLIRSSSSTPVRATAPVEEIEF